MHAPPGRDHMVVSRMRNVVANEPFFVPPQMRSEITEYHDGSTPIRVSCWIRVNPRFVLDPRESAFRAGSV
jgi:hypothetical protein